ncbi:MAG: YdcF family protein [Ruminococcaceae bacterium]|nr:YdcF family protein [Oscillospiraceae bacterium]
MIKAVSDFIFMDDIELSDTDALYENNADKVSDIIFVPGDSHPHSSERAAILWKAGLAPKILISGNYGMKNGTFVGIQAKANIYNGDYSSEVELMTDVLLKNGVDESCILTEGEARHTKENALFSRKICDENGVFPRKAIICCKSFHARRCFMSYALAFPDTKLFVSSVNVYDITKDNWYTFEYGIHRVMGEVKRCGEYYEREIVQRYASDLYDSPQEVTNGR